jgi:hypothetical protein
VLDATEHLHTTVSKMRNRLRDLEAAIAQIQAGNSDATHPLLTQPFNEEPPETAEEGHSWNLPLHSDVIGSLSTLSSSERGVARFYGAGTEVSLYIIICNQETEIRLT